MPPDLPTTESGIDAFIAAFEDGTLPKERWTHAAHLLTGACYVHAYGEAAATDRMRERVSAYNVAVGGQNTFSSGYHETVTVFWIKLLRDVLASLKAQHPGIGRGELVHMAVEGLVNERNIYWEFYDFDILKSEEARRVWIWPNVRPFEEQLDQPNR
jgi:hypothetical protein